MKRQMLAVALFCFVSACGGGGSNGHQQELDAMVEQEWSDYTKTLSASAGGLALFIETPNSAHFASTGIENASPDTHFRVASNTKTFTAAAIMLLQQDGKLDIDDFVTGTMPGRSEAYLPDTSDYAIPYKSQITIKQLLGHNAGVFDVGNNVVPSSCDAPYAGQYYDGYVRDSDDSHTFSLDEIVGVVARCRLSFFAPGTDHKYSNTGYTILAKIIERVSGLSYAEFIQERLLIPNELWDTSVPSLGSDRTIPAPYAPGSFIARGVLTAWTEDNMSFNIAEGNIISTPRDLARWVRRLINGQAGPTKESVAEMTACVSKTSENSCYGLGISEYYQPVPGLGHSGAHAGYLSLMMHDPDNNVTTIVFSSLLNFDGVFAELDMEGRVRNSAHMILGYN